MFLNWWLGGITQGAILVLVLKLFIKILGAKSKIRTAYEVVQQSGTARDKVKMPNSYHVSESRPVHTMYDGEPSSNNGRPFIC